MSDGVGNAAGDRDGAEGASGTDRLTAPPDGTRRPRLPFPVVGIGASAGGLEAFSQFLEACPADAGMAFVLIQHLPPDRESMLPEILARRTHMPVSTAEDGQAVEVDHVYVIRPGHTLTILDGRLRLGRDLAARGHGRPVDDFFRSLAEEQQQRAIAVVLSGMGSNGSAGAQAVKAVGGLVIAQEPESAKYLAMPRALIDAHLADYILRPEEMPAALIRYAGQPYVADEAPAEQHQEEQVLAEVLAVLRTRTRHDFTGYRKPTIQRRVRRRMGLGQFGTMPDYVRALRQAPAEVTALADDLLIHVTGFFRDPDAWEALREKVIEPLVDSRPNGAEVRCWVAACATGEEAYSLAMLLVESSEARGKRFDLKVFATDMAERALGAARTGIFPNGVESEISPERLARFFEKDDSFYRVRKELRELVVFAPQNVLQDPPFSRLDVATCRNLLIYLEPETQRRVLSLLHFGLREGGALMLGSSESAALAEGDFEPIDKRNRLYRRVGPTRTGTLNLPAVVASSRELRPSPGAGPRVARPDAPPAQLVVRELLERHTPAAVAVDADGQIVHVHGDTSRFLALPSGSPTLDLIAMASEQVRGAVRTALHRASESQAPVVVRDGLVKSPEGPLRVEVGAAPLGQRGGPPLYLVTFRDYPEPPPPALGAPDDGRMADELQRARDELQGAVEEMQSSHEELKAAHEEATSLNEELQSSNEELETNREEMQSLNEELVTVNSQLQAKMAELEATANDLGSLLTSTDIAVLFLDTKLRIRRFTPAVRDLLDMIPSDIGRPFVDLRLKFADPDLLEDARQVLEKLVPIERAVESESGRRYLRRVLPYRTQDDRIDGVVVAFVDVTERRRADAALKASQERQAFLLKLSDALRRLDDPVEMQSTAARLLGRHLGAQQAYFGETVGDEALIRQGDKQGRPRMVGRYPRRDYGEQLFQAHLAGRTAVSTDVREDPTITDAEREALAAAEIGSYVAAPLVKGGVWVATLAVHGGGPRAWSAEEVSLVEETAERTWTAVERARADAALLAGARWHAGQKAAFLAAVEGAPLEESLGELVRTAVETLGEGTRAAFYLSEDGGRTLRHVVGMAPEDSDAADAPGIGDGSPAPAPAVAEAAPLTAGAMDDPRWEPWRAMAERLGYRGCWSFPIHSSSGTFIGSFAVYSRTPREATGRDLELASLMTDAASIIISRHAESRARAEAEAALRESEGRLRLALAAARMGIWTLDPATGLHARDANLNRLLGLEGEETLRPFEQFLDHVHPDDRRAVSEAFADSTREGRPLNIEFRIVRPDGSVRWLRDQGDVFGDAASGARLMAGACVDVTELKEAEESRRAGEEVFRAVTDVVPDLLWRLDPEAGTGWVNRRWVEYTGLENDAAHPWGWLEAVHPDDRAGSREAFERGMEAGEPFRFEHRLRRASDGAYRWFLVGSVPLRDAEGRIVSWFGAVTDVHDQKAARDELEASVEERTAELMAALGSLEAEMTRRRELARRLSSAQEDERRRVSRDLHDSVGQLLAGLSMSFKAVEEAGGLPPRAADKLARAKQLVESLGAEVHALAVRLRPTSLDDVGLEPSLGQLVAEWSGRTGVRVDLHATGLDEGRLGPDIETTLYRVVQEAMTNVARHARASVVSVLASRQDGSVTVVVEDDGTGFAPDSDAPGRLGLVGMRERVALVGGVLEIETEPGSGTTIRARIPLAGD